MEYKIIPQPQKISAAGAFAVSLADGFEIIVEGGAQKAADDFCRYMKLILDAEPGGGAAKVSICVNDGLGLPEQGYRLSVSENLVKIEGADEAGAFYAVQTLKQLALQTEGRLCEVEIEDYPMLLRRGFMLDCARYFFTPEAVRLFIDAMAMHKLNVLHWHLTDDQGWRIELYSKLRLAQIGSTRAYTNFGTRPHSGYYSVQDIKDIIEYARQRCIKVVAEIDTPGHVVSAIAAYPHLSCFNRRLEVATHSGVKHDVLCVGKQSTYDFVFEVLDEVLEMFGGSEIHLGGDEVPTTRWSICPNCRRLMREKGMSEPGELHAYYINRLAERLSQKGVKLTMWNDGECKYEYDPRVAFQYWGKGGSLPEALREQARRGRKIIASRLDAWYLDLPYASAPLENAYNTDPYLGLEGSDRQSVLGGEACLWTEYVPSMKKAGYCVFPRLGAFCEALWTSESQKSYDSFLNRLDFYRKLVETLSFTSATRRQAVPGIIRKYGYLLYFERRQLHYQGLHNIIDNRRVKKLAEANGDGKFD